MDGMYQNNNLYGQQNSEYQLNNMPEKKKGNGIKIAVGIACVLAALICIGIGALAYYRSTPSYKVNKGLQNLAMEIVQMKNPLAEKIGMGDILLMMQEEGFHAETELNVPVNAPVIGKTTIGVDTDFNKDVPGKELSAEMSISMMNWDAAHLNIYADDEAICFSIPELLMEDLYIENENVISRYNGSIWSRFFSPSDLKDFSIELFPDKDKRVSMRDLRKISTIMEDFEEDFNALREGMITEKTEPGVYRVTYPSKETDRLLKDLLENYAKLYDEAEALKELQSYDKLVDSDVILLFEIDSTNRIGSIVLESPIEILDGRMSFEGEIFFLGETRSIDKTRGEVAVSVADKNPIEVIWQAQMTSYDTIYQVDTELKWTEDEDTTGKMKFVVNCDAVDDEFDMTFSMKNETKAIEFVLEGSVDDIVKGESVELDLDEAVFSMNGKEFKVTGDVSIEPLTESVKPLAKPETAFFEMTNSDLMVILYRLGNEYGGIFGSLLKYL